MRFRPRGVECPNVKSLCQFSAAPRWRYETRLIVTVLEVVRAQPGSDRAESEWMEAVAVTKSQFLNWIQKSRVQWRQGIAGSTAGPVCMAWRGPLKIEG